MKKQLGKNPDKIISEALRVSKNMVVSVITLILLYMVGLYHQYYFFIKQDGSVSVWSMLRFLVVIVVAVVVINEVIGVLYILMNRDQLTGIYNSECIMRTGGKLFFRKKLYDYTALFINLRDYKFINRKLGNKAGDVVLRRYAQMMEASLKKKGYVGRLGGDNFLVFIKNEYLDEFLDLIKLMTVTVYTPEDEQIHQVPIQARVGVAPIVPGMEYREIINHASLALVKAKNSVEPFVYFDPEMETQMISDKETLIACRAAMKNKEFIAFYQPKVDAKTGVLCGAEALVRWKRDGAIISPYHFVPLMEREGDIVTLDYMIFEMVCADIRGWLDRGIESVRVSTNFSKLHLHETEFAMRIFDIMQRYNIDSKYLEVELTESTGSEDWEALKDFSAKIREKGIHISIDDFGTGYSSLSLLKNFDADVIKLDKSFLDSAQDGREESKVFIQDIITMINNQHEMILCEGVETQEQLDFLVSSGCSIIQGYYFDKPMDHDAFEARLLDKKYF